MKLALTFKFKNLIWATGYAVADFVSRYLKSYFGESNIKINENRVTWNQVPIEFKDAEVARIQDLVEIAHNKFSDSSIIIGETLDDFISDKAADKKNMPDWEQSYWASCKTENIRFGVTVLFD